MSILDVFKEDCKANPTPQDYNTALQAEVARQMKAIADYDANPEILDSQIKFNPEEFDYDERPIADILGAEEDNNYPEADDPEALLKMTLENKTDVDSKEKEIKDILTYLEPCECNEVKVGDKLKIYNKKTKNFDVVEVSSVSKLYNAFTYEPVVGVVVTYDYDGAPENAEHGQRKLSDPNVYYKVGSDEPIKQFTIKE